MMVRSLVGQRRRPSLLAAVLALVLLATSCGGSAGAGDRSPLPSDAESGPPQRGGRVIYGLEAETANGYCLPDAQLVISGIQVARSVYDTLTVPNADGGYSPYLAEKVESSPDFKTWTITVRDGVKFHDGTPLDATVVKNNLDAYRGVNPKRTALLFQFVFDNIDTVTTTDARTVVVTTKTPWVAFPAFLYGSGRIGIMAQSQLDADEATCATHMVGTGPFRLRSWTPYQELVVDRNPGYWLQAPDGQPYPYLDQIEFRPIPQSSTRLTDLQNGDVNVVHMSDPLSITALEKSRDAGTVRLQASNRFSEVAYILLNSGKAPFDDQRVRQALALGIDRQALNQELNGGSPELATGPFAPGNVGNLAESGFPSKADPAKAKALVEDYERTVLGGKPLEVTLSVTPTPEGLTQGAIVQRQAAAFGLSVKIQTLEQSKIVTTAIGGNYQMMTFRNHPGGDPDTQFVWWYGIDNPVNFGRFNDPDINALLQDGRSDADPASRKRIYEAINRRFGVEAYNIWLWYVTWAIATAPDVHGISGPALPDGAKPFPGLANGHSVTGLWVE